MSAEHPVRALQALDSEADGLRAERDGLPERTRLREGIAELERIAAAREEAGTRLAGVKLQEAELEKEVAEAAARVASVDRNLYSGEVTSPKELEALQAELALCQGTRDALEERELVLMEQVEGIEGEIEAMVARTAELHAEGEALRAAILAAEERIDADLARLATERETVTPDVPEELLRNYEKMRGVARLAGVVMSHLSNDTCGACRVNLPVKEVSRLRSGGPGSFGSCPSCQRLILV